MCKCRLDARNKQYINNIIIINKVGMKINADVNVKN